MTALPTGPSTIDEADRLPGPSRNLRPIAATRAIDPGYGYSEDSGTAVVAVSGLRLLHSAVLRPTKDEDDVAFFHRVRALMDAIVKWYPEEDWASGVTAVENFTYRPHKRSRSANAPDGFNWRGPVETAKLAGELWGHYRGRYVMPALHGKRAGSAADRHLWYPRALCGRRPAEWLTLATETKVDRLHEASAYDVAFAAWGVDG